MYYQQRPTYPQVDTTQLKSSAKAFQPLMDDADKVLNEFVKSGDFAYNVKDAAQRSQTEKIKIYLTQLGVSHQLEINYNPDAIKITFINQTNSVECCRLTVSLKW